MNWNEYQNQIAEDYCGSVLVLDDEILSGAEASQVNALFLQTKQSFERRGINCDLRHVTREFDDADGTAAILRQVRRADTVIVDWYLGEGMDKEKESKNAVAVLKELIAKKGFRFAIIHTKESAEIVVANLKHTFSDSFKNVVSPKNAATGPDDSGIVVESEESPKTSSDSASPSTYCIDGSLYLSVVTKTNIADIPSLFAEGLKFAFPDHLHWAGFEFAGRVRSLLPQLLAALPPGTDVALVFQSLFQQGKDELADCIAECLTEEIRQLLMESPLVSVSDETMISKLRDGVVANRESLRTEFTNQNWNSDWTTTTPDAIKNACIESADSRFPLGFGALFPARRKGNPHYIPGLKEQMDIISDFLRTAIVSPFPKGITLHQGFAALREHLQSAKPVRLEPGVVLRSGDSAAWLVCVSPACDCARGEHERQYLFLDGVISETPKKLSSCILIEGEYRHVKWSRNQIVTIDCPPAGPENWSFQTRLHDAFVHELVQAVWGHQTRAGVSTSDYIRKLRTSE